MQLDIPSTRLSGIQAPPTSMIVTTRDVTADEADIRLDRWFRRHYPWLTQGVLQKLCRTGQIRVNGARAAPTARLAFG